MLTGPVSGVGGVQGWQHYVKHDVNQVDDLRQSQRQQSLYLAKLRSICYRRLRYANLLALHE